MFVRSGKGYFVFCGRNGLVPYAAVEAHSILIQRVFPLPRPDMLPDGWCESAKSLQLPLALVWSSVSGSTSDGLAAVQWCTSHAHGQCRGTSGHPGLLIGRSIL
jgi:hypothetical protein